MDLRYGLISVDDHVQEHPTVWLDRLPKARWGERIPHIEQAADGSERWLVDGAPVLPGSVASAGALMGDRACEPARWAEVPAAAYVPAERLKAMDADGVDCSVLYPTVAGRAGETFARLTDAQLELACVRAYNDWVIEEWAGASDRFVPQCIVPLSSNDAAAAEIERAVGRGHRGVLLPSVPSDFRGLPLINEPYWDPIWAACERLGVPICFHAGASDRIQLLPHQSYSPALAEALRAMTRPASTVFVLVNFLLSRILDRFPRLRAVFAESGIAWAAFVLEYADHQFGNDRLSEEGYRSKPSELFRRNCYLTGSHEGASVQTIPFIGVDNILWATHFPLASSTWPHTHATVGGWRAALTEEHRRRVLWANAADLYRIEVAGLRTEG
jgi:predicted TIM-barrel fold metal-dependent hydrolase